MNKTELYRNVLRDCVVAGALIAQHDFSELLADIERAETVGPVIDPTLYREKSTALHQDRELLAAALPLWKFYRKHLATGLETPR